MKPSSTVKRFAWLVLLMPLCSGKALADTYENYTFINEYDAPGIYTAPEEFWQCQKDKCEAVLNMQAYSNQELKEQGLDIGDDKNLVISFKQLAVWLSEESKWDGQSSISKSDKFQRDASLRLDEIAKSEAIKKALIKVNNELGMGLSKEEVSEISAAIEPRWETLLSMGRSYVPLEPRKDTPDTGTRGREEDDTSGTKLQYIVSGYYFRFNREIILDAIQPSVEATSYVVPKLSIEPRTDEVTYVMDYQENLKLPEKLRGQKRENERQQLFQDLVRKLAEQSFITAILRTNNSLSPPISPSELQSIIGDHDYREFASVHLNKQQINRGEFVDGYRKETLQIDLSVSFSRDKIKNLLAPPPTETSFLGPDIYSSDYDHVVKFRDEMRLIPRTDGDPKHVQREIFDKALEEMRRDAFGRAYHEINGKAPERLTGEELTSFLATKSYLDLSPNWEIKRQEIARRGRTETLHLTIHFYYDKASIADDLVFTSKTNFAGPDIDPANYSHIVAYEDVQRAVPPTTGAQEDIQLELFDKTREELRQRAFDTAFREINDGLPEKLSLADLDSFLDKRNYLELTENWVIKKQEVTRRGLKETLHLTINFYYDKANIASELISRDKTNFAAPKINPADFPSETTYVVKYEDEPFAITSDGATNDATRLAVYKNAIEELSKAAFKDAVIQVNKGQRNPQSNDVIAKFIQEHTKYSVHDEEQKNFQQYTQNYEIKNQVLVRRGLNEQLNLTVYFYFDRETLGNAFRPPLEIIPTHFADAGGDFSPLSDTNKLEVAFENIEETVSQEIENRDIAQRQTFDNAIDKYARKALRVAISKVNKRLEKPKTPTELEALIQEIGDDHRKYTQNRKITDQAISRRGSSTKAEETLQLTMYFYFDRPVIKDLIQPAMRVTVIKVDPTTLLDTDIPASDDQTIVVVFRDKEAKVATDIQNRDVAITEAAKKAVKALKEEAFQLAADDIKHALDQNTDFKEFDRAVAKASRNFQSFIRNTTLFDQTISKRDDLSTAAETYHFSVYFEIDRKELRKALIEGRGLTEVGRKRTYVELYWNFPGKKENFPYPAELIEETTKAIVEHLQDYFLMKNYEVVEFERIQNELIKLAEREEVEGISEDDVSSQDEYDRLMSNINLRNISNWSTGKAKEGSRSQHEVGNQILTEYLKAELLISVTINAIEQNKQERTVTVRQTIKAKVFERNEWIPIGMSDGFSTKPFSGKLKFNATIEMNKNLARKLASELEPKISHKLARRKAAEDLLTDVEREFTVVFKGLTKKQFHKIRRLLMNKKNPWEYKGTEVKNRLVRISSEGGIDNLVLEMEEMFEKEGENAGFPEWKSNDTTITFDASE